MHATPLRFLVWKQIKQNTTENSNSNKEWLSEKRKKIINWLIDNTVETPSKVKMIPYNKKVQPKNGQTNYKKCTLLLEHIVLVKKF